MRIKAIELRSNDKQIVDFFVGGPDFRNPYILKGITGLDAEEITPMFYGQGETSDIKFYDMVLQPREIVMRIALNPDYNLGGPADLRGDLYKAVASSRSGLMQVRLKDDEVPVGVINGFVTKFEGPVSTREPEVQITLRCNDPLFKALDITGYVVTDLDEAAPLIIDPVSTAPHGFKLKLTFTGSVNPFIIKDPDDEWEFRIDYPFISGDELYFSSVNGDKYIFRIRSGVTLHLMDVIQAGSVWPIIFPGENQFEITGTSFTWNDLYWNDTHWGV